MPAKNYGSFTREPAKRIFAQELSGAIHSFKESNDDKAPTFHVLPSGEKCNRVLIIGTLTHKEKKGDNHPMYVARIADPTGTFYVNAGSYQPEAMMQLAKLEPVTFVCAIGKINSYETPDKKILISIRIETIVPASEELKNKWVLDTAEQTLHRLNNLQNSPYLQTIETDYWIKPDTIRSAVKNAVATLPL
ncbi:hypothetical protein [Bacteroides sp.]|uniref:hypothetical protein n=1 Tax=Bacteroides sp. TaxID=29523 RepID=UPI00260CECBB|nr:hypothetical protein [Bacteroides sp.]MDD3039108.1 hypothetical protein [Bacteroides sp.]